VLLATRLREVGSASFRGLTGDADSVLVVVARFLALLELYREGAVAFDQVTALGDLHIRWVAGEEAAAELDRWAHETGETDEYDAAKEEAP
jgi:segregation and condensation protein A